MTADGHTRQVGSDDATQFLNPHRGQRVPLPSEVLAAGRVRVSGLIHPMGPEFLGMKRHQLEGFMWPEESGGAARLAQIIELIDGLRSGAIKFERRPQADARALQLPVLSNVDYRLYDLVEPERERQRRRMLAAMERVIGLTRD